MLTWCRVRRFAQRRLQTLLRLTVLGVGEQDVDFGVEVGFRAGRGLLPRRTRARRLRLLRGLRLQASGAEQQELIRALGATPVGTVSVREAAEAISRGVAYAPYADLVWCETGTPDLGFAREFAQAVHAACPGKLLSYNCSPSFNWKKNLDDRTIARFQDELSALGYKYQFITLAGIHINWFNTFQFAHAYARGEGMKHYTEMVQEPEFKAREQGYTFVSHQQEVGAGYFDDVTTVIQGGSSSVKALTGSTEEEQFH